MAELDHTCIYVAEKVIWIFCFHLVRKSVTFVSNDESVIHYHCMYFALIVMGRGDSVRQSIFDLCCSIQDSLFLPLLVVTCDLTFTQVYSKVLKIDYQCMLCVSVFVTLEDQVRAF